MKAKVWNWLADISFTVSALFALSLIPFFFVIFGLPRWVKDTITHRPVKE